MIEMHYWEQLAAIAQASTLSQAAEELCITQPALSRSMQRLEAQLGVTLFDRTSNRIALNANGELAAHLAERLLEQEAELVDQVRAHDRASRTIELVSCASFPVRELVPVLAEACPGATVAAEVLDDDSLIERLDAGGTVLAVSRAPIELDDILCRPYLTEQLYLLASGSDPLAARDKLTFSDIDGITMLLYAHTGVWQQMVEQGLPHTRFLLQEDMATFRELVETTDLPSFTSSWHLERSGTVPGKVAIPIVDASATLTYWLCCRRDSLALLDAAMQAL